MKRFWPRQGFTLIELMVAITIVAVLAVMALYIFSAAFRSSRDNQRRQALNAYQQALELYRRDNGHYPETAANLSALIPTYIAALFIDPSSSAGYSYSYLALPSPPACDNVTNFCTSYCLYATLENLSTSPVGSCSSSIPSNTIVFNYWVSSP